MQIKNLRVEYKVNPLGIDASNPRFSWEIVSDEKGVVQESWRILAYADEAKFSLLWDSGKVRSGQTSAVEWKGEKLHSFQRVYWNVSIHHYQSD